MSEWELEVAILENRMKQLRREARATNDLDAMNLIMQQHHDLAIKRIRLINQAYTEANDPGPPKGAI